MPRMVKWDEKLTCVRPCASKQFSFITQKTANRLEQYKDNTEDFTEIIAEIASEVWFSQCLQGYASDMIDIKEVPADIWET